MTECSECGGKGYIMKKGHWSFERVICLECNGRGFTRRFRYYETDYQELLRQEQLETLEKRVKVLE